MTTAIPGACIFEPCVATWRHWHGGFPGGYDNPADPEGAPISFEGDEPDEGVRDYNGAPLRVQATRSAQHDSVREEDALGEAPAVPFGSPEPDPSLPGSGDLSLGL